MFRRDGTWDSRQSSRYWARAVSIDCRLQIHARICNILQAVLVVSNEAGCECGGRVISAMAMLASDRMSYMTSA